MSYDELKNLVRRFRTNGDAVEITRCENGHINKTYIVRCINSAGEEHRYVLQKINDSVFKKPLEVMENIVNITDFLREKIAASGGDPTRETLTLTRGDGGKPYCIDENGQVWRCYDFIRNARSYESVEKPILFYNAAYAFGKFQRQLSDFPAEQLYETIPNFHNTVSRHADFRAAVKNDLAHRASGVQDEINFILEREGKCAFIVNGIENGTLPLRVTHNDTKLNNIMMDNDTDEGVCVIDLDTVMPGSVLYDFGDSIRFGASSAAEDETDLSKVYVRLDLFEEFTRGFIAGLGGSLSENEIRALPMGAYVITLETGMRFLGDHLNGDTYFAIHRENHNLDRARTQLKLVSDMEAKMDEMNAIVAKYL